MSIRQGDLVVLSRLLDQVLDLEPAQQQVWLAALPDEQRHLVPVLRDMLAARDAADGHPGLLTSIPALPPVPDDVLAVPGERVGPYRLVREIGRGGMGEVWLAERADGSFRRNVALKLPHVAWGAGLVARMAREREIGALLEHPNIARLYDAGVDDRGRPYLALEYIDGVAIDAWCRQHGLTVAQKLTLVAQVARAVSYAHGRLVVHRDIKPSNVLVSADGQPHLLDFGIAKLLADAVAGSPGVTQDMGRVLTPNYASPEQMRGEAITVASDVYSLGVLAYELLTGRLPYEPRRRTLAALEQAMAQGATPLASQAAPDRATARMLKGEVDAILAKAMHPDVARRYASVDAFADDIGRLLRNEPVQARPDSRWYRGSKMLRRHRVGFAAGGTVLAAVLGASAVALVQSNHADRAAQRERLVKEFVLDVFRVNVQGASTNEELRSIPAEMLLQHGASLIEKRFPGQPDLQADLYGVVAGIFADMGAHQLAVDYGTRHIDALAQSSARPSVQARANLALAQSMLRIERQDDAHAAAARALQLAGSDDELAAHAITWMAVSQRQLGRPADAIRTLQQAQARLANARHADSAAKARVMYLQEVWREPGHFDESLARRLAALDMGLRVEGPTSTLAWDMQLGIAHELIDRKRGDEAIRLITPPLEARERRGGLVAVGAAIERAAVWERLHTMGQITGGQALAALRQARSVVETQGLALPASVHARLDFEEAVILRDFGRIAQAQALMARSLPTLRAATKVPSAMFSFTVSEGLLAMIAGDHDAAHERFSQSWELRRAIRAELGPFSAYAYAVMALNRVMQGQFEQTRRILDQAPTFAAVPGMPDGHVTAEVLQWERARLLMHQGDARGALGTMRQLTPPGSVDHVLSAGALLAEASCAAGAPEQGLERILRLIDARAKRVHAHDPVLARHRAVAGLCALAAGQREQAERLAHEAREAFKAEPGVSPYFRRPLADLAQRLRR
jgi:serine/threonine protein kinase